MVKLITEFNEIPLDKKVIIDFFADWCGPCKRIAPEFLILSEQYKDIVFLKVDVEASPLLADNFNITSLPTFVIQNSGEIITTIKGGNLDSIKLNLNNLQLI